jgi:hypothetical protein
VRRVAAGAALATAIIAVAASAWAAPGQGANLRVAGCPTVYGSSGPHPRPPATVVTRAPAATADRLAAFGNGDLLVVGPRGWRCLAITGANGGARMTLWPPGRPGPTRARPLRTPSPFAVVADVQPACVGCIADLTCVLPTRPGDGHPL